jgi:hypothetical protein
LIFKDIALWSNAFKTLFKKKKMEQDKGSKAGGTMLNPWRVIQGIQSYIVKKNVEDEIQNVILAHSGCDAQKRGTGPNKLLLDKCQPSSGPGNRNLDDHSQRVSAP